MTAFKTISRGQFREQFNKKDGQICQRPNDLSTFREITWASAGFKPAETPGEYTYTWEGAFPVFTIKPEIIKCKLHWVARSGDWVEYFPYNALLIDIRDRLDDLIYDIMRGDPEEIDWSAWESDGLAIDFDYFMATVDNEEN